MMHPKKSKISASSFVLLSLAFGCPAQEAPEAAAAAVQSPIPTQSVPAAIPVNAPEAPAQLRPAEGKTKQGLFKSLFEKKEEKPAPVAPASDQQPASKSLPSVGQPEGFPDKFTAVGNLLGMTFEWDAAAGGWVSTRKYQPNTFNPPSQMAPRTVAAQAAAGYVPAKSKAVLGKDNRWIITPPKKRG
jgi:hypothetical protein